MIKPTLTIAPQWSGKMTAGQKIPKKGGGVSVPEQRTTGGWPRRSCFFTAGCWARRRQIAESGLSLEGRCRPAHINLMRKGKVTGSRGEAWGGKVTGPGTYHNSSKQAENERGKFLGGGQFIKGKRGNTGDFIRGYRNDERPRPQSFGNENEKRQGIPLTEIEYASRGVIPDFPLAANTKEENVRGYDSEHQTHSSIGKACLPCSLPKA